MLLDKTGYVGSSIIFAAVMGYGPSSVPAQPDRRTPPPGLEPKINGPAVYGARPGHPFVYRIPCTGNRPITFAAENLPPSLTLDEKSGIITGTTPTDRGDCKITLKAANALGSVARTFTLVVGDTLALTPPMGWNSWYAHYQRVTDADMRAAAEAMITSGMADFGYQYVSIDDCWMKKKGDTPYRGPDNAILPNAQFPDMKALTDAIHGKGLRAGIYTSPGPWTCAGYVGSYQHEEIDAHTFAKWGFDFLKYDWCAYRNVATGEGLDRFQKPYRLMGEILKTLDRDVVFNLCQYGMGDVWTWGDEVGGQCWRTTGDLGLAPESHLPGFYHIGLSNAAHAEYAGPGRWNDPDYILIGWVGDAHKQGINQPTTLTPAEQYSYMSMWCLMASPLIFSGDMTRLDDFTLNVLCNAEMIEVNQDPLGKQARILHHADGQLIMAKPMQDGSWAVGLFNLGKAERTISLRWSDLGVEGKQNVRDLWRQKDLGVFADTFEAAVPSHDVVVVRIRPS